MAFSGGGIKRAGQASEVGAQGDLADRAEIARVRGRRIAWSQVLEQGLEALASGEDGHDVPEAAAARADKPSMATERPTSAS
jgi:hypothetical protein